MIQITPYQKEHSEKWNAFIQEAENSNFLFHREFMEYHQDRFTDASCLLFENEVLTAVFPANKKDDCIYSHQGLTYGGLILKERKNVKKLTEYFHELVSYYKNLGTATIFYKPVPNCFCKSTNEIEYFFLNMLSAAVTKVDTFFVLDNRDEWKVQERRRRSIKKAQKLNTRIEIDNDFDSYWNGILIPNLQEKFGAQPTHSLEEIKLLHSRFPHIKQANAYINDEIVAGITLFEFENSVHCQYISSNDHGRDFGAIDLLTHYLIELYRPEKTYFSLGTANNRGNDINFGLCDWKEGWGARIYAHSQYQFETANLKGLEKLME